MNTCDVRRVSGNIIRDAGAVGRSVGKLRFWWKHFGTQNRDNPYRIGCWRRVGGPILVFRILTVLYYIILYSNVHTHIFQYIYIFTRRTVRAQKFIRDLCVLPVARALLTYCLFAWTSAIYQKLLIVSAAVASVAPSNFIPENRHPKTTTSRATLSIILYTVRS